MDKKPKTSSFRRKLALGVFIVLMIPLLSFVTLVGYIAWKMNRAEDHARALCAAYPKGSSIAGFETRAEELGMASSPIPAPRDASELVEYRATEGLFTSSWTCRLETTDGTVQRAAVEYED